jgi:hypothetical protein
MLHLEARKEFNAMQTPRPSRYGERFYRSRRNNLGIILSVGAGLLTYGFMTWPIAFPQGHGNLGPFWAIAAFCAAASYIYAAWKADTNWRLARMVLFVAGALHIVVGLITSVVLGPVRDGLY